MNTYVCKLCNIILDISEFNTFKNGNTKKICNKCDANFKKYYLNNKTDIIKKIKIYQKKNKQTLNKTISCDVCFKQFQYKYKSSHIRSKYHLFYLNNKKKEIKINNNNNDNNDKVCFYIDFDGE